MEKTKKIKLFIGLSYLLIVSLFLYFFFSKFSLQEITSYDFLRNNRSYLIELKNSNLFLASITFVFLTVLWVFPFLGFGYPVAIMGGFIFGIEYAQGIGAQPRLRIWIEGLSPLLKPSHQCVAVGLTVFRGAEAVQL